MKITLYELFTLCNINESDIADNTYDFVVGFSCHLKKGQCKDYYDTLMRLFATQIECDRFDIDSPSLAHCNIREYIRGNIDIFIDFMEKNNREEYQPSHYYEDLKGGIDNETFYDLFMTTFENLVIGNYAEEQYKELLFALGGSR